MNDKEEKYTSAFVFASLFLLLVVALSVIVATVALVYLAIHNWG